MLGVSHGAFGWVRVRMRCFLVRVPVLAAVQVCQASW